MVYDGCRQVLTAEYNSSLLNNPCLSTVPVKIGAVLAFWFDLRISVAQEGDSTYLAIVSKTEG